MTLPGSAQEPAGQDKAREISAGLLARPAKAADIRSLRLRQFAVAVAATLIAITLYFACYLGGFVDSSVFVLASAAALACAMAFFAMFYSGANARLSDPSMILPQAMCAVALTSYVMAHAGPARPALALLYFAVLVFAAFRFSWRVFISLAVFVVLSHAAAIYAASRIDARPINLAAELIQWSCILVMTPWLGWMAAMLDGQRKQFKAGAALYRAIWNTSIDAVVIFDQGGAIRLANPAALRLFGRDAADLRNMHVAQLAPERQRAALERDLGQYLANGSMGRDWTGFEDIALRADGREVFVEAAVVELGGTGGRPDLFDAGGRRLALFARDVSQRHAIEAIKDDFITSMSHELRTPLTAVMGAVEALQAAPAGALPDDARSLLAMAASGADRLNALINTMLNLQKMDSGRIEFAPAAMLVSDLIDGAFASEEPAVRARGKYLAVAHSEGRQRVKADARWIHQVLVNLIDNAVKYSPSGATVVLGSETREATVRFSVIDQGSGVPDQFADRLFTRFARADNSNTRIHEGSGLGLSLSKAAVEGCGGTIGFFNNATKGATFWFELPRARG